MKDAEISGLNPPHVTAPQTITIGHWVAIALGANLGARAQTIERAIAALGSMPRTRLLARSALYRSAPVQANGPDYCNAVVAVRTQLEPLALLDALQAIEHACGRRRPWANAPRTLDLDILLWDEQRITLPRLTVPHPRMYGRAFVLVPLAEIAPARVTPQQLRAVAGQRIVRMGAVAQGKF